MLADMVSANGDNYNLTVYEGWRWKMARYSRLIDITESGSDRKMSQKYKHAKEMVAYWKSICGDEETALAAATAGRIVGKAVNLRCTPDPSAASGYPFWNEGGDNVRYFPSYRFLIVRPSILG
jgi:hypothetical protein